MSLKIQTKTGEQEVATASEAVRQLDEVRGEELPVVKVEPETESPQDVTESQREIEGRQRNS